MKDKFISIFGNYFLGPDKRSRNVEVVTDKIWNRVETLATKGIEEEELVLDKSMSIENKAEVAEQVQVVAEQIARRGRGRHR